MADEKTHTGDDAVCFTSGPAGAPFAAGVIHAWLASNRKRPRVAAGISMGAISAAAMRRVYQEMDAATTAQEREQKRWEWYRRYLAGVTQNPLAAVWNAVPDPVDFFGKLPPVKDLSTPDPLRGEAEQARRHYFLLTRLGVWMAHLPVRVSTVATVAVMYVRRKESYGGYFGRTAAFWWNCAKLALGLTWHVLRHPSFVTDHWFDLGKQRGSGWHPLLGWGLYGIAIGAGILMALLVAAALALTATVSISLHETLRGLGLLISYSQNPVLPAAAVFLAWAGCAILSFVGLCFVLVSAGAGFRAVRARGAEKRDRKRQQQHRRAGDFFNDFARRFVFGPLDIAGALLHPFEARRQLYDLFGTGPAARPASDVYLLTVCAAVESTEQVLLRCDMPVVDALSAAIAIPGLYPPRQVSAKQMVKAPQTEQPPKDGTYSLIDGAAVRTNPLPAFFEWCKQPGNRAIAEALDASSAHAPSLHVVYNVPIAYSGNVADAPGIPCPDIVESAKQALRLEKRRDTRQEVRMTNYMSRLERLRRKSTGQTRPQPRGPFAIDADEIAPAEDLDMGNALAPEPKKLMKIVAQGCRSTLESLYSKELQDMGPCADCRGFMQKMAQANGSTADSFVPGLPEVCSCCTGVLKAKPRRSPEGPDTGIVWSYGKPGDGKSVNAAQELAHLANNRPKIVFLGSGGVFRGAFHIGVLAAMAQAKVYPDLVIGASVGALMGGALCHITAGPQANEADVVFRLASLFLNVDSKVALTRTLKNATKQLGTRARSIRLSPSELTRMVEKGSKADPGFAATGAPPALIDALSSLFTVPHRETAAISSEFVAGHFSKASLRFLRQVRKETLTSFDIQNAVIGVSMLADQARALLGWGTAEVDLSRVQPYNGPKARKPVSFFSTTSYLNARTPLLLGRDFLTLNPTWDGVYAGLCSSAFPAAFAPRQEADLLPGAGKVDRFFADGGLFDNLPFFPAIEILSDVQKGTAQVPLTAATVADEICRRAARPNIFIAAGLNAKPDLQEPCESFLQIKERASSLSVNTKTDSFARAARKITRDLRAAGKGLRANHGAGLSQQDLRFLHGSVSAKVISILPADKEHINPTFAFCSSTGLKKQRVQRSIADGCFQTLAQFATNQHALGRAGAGKVSTLPRGQAASHSPNDAKPRQACPFYQVNGSPLTCPFTIPPTQPAQDDDAERERNEVLTIFSQCKNDPAHEQAACT